MATEGRLFIKDGPLRQISTPKYDRAAAHRTLVREATDKASEGLDPFKVRPRPGYVWGRIIDVYVTDQIAPSIERPANAKASVRHWIETVYGRRLIFEYARGSLIRTSCGEWLMVEEKYILAEFGDERPPRMLNRSILLEVEPLPTHTGMFFDPSARQVQAEIGRVVDMAFGADLLLYEGDRIAFFATAGTYCLIDGKEYRIIDRDQALGVIEPEVPGTTPTYST